MRDWRGLLPDDVGPLRDHQEQAFKRARLVAARDTDEKITVLQATPGAGKSMAAVLFANVLIRAGFVDRVVVVVPRDSLREQMCEAFAEAAERGLTLKVAAAASEVSSKVIFGNAGYVTTYQAVAQRAGARHLKAVENCRVLLILDEIHHLVDEEGRGWVPGVKALVEHATHVLAMSGNLGRDDEKPIPFIPYGDDKSPIKHIVYSRRTALDEHAIIPLNVVLQDGDTEYFHKGREHEVTLSTASAKEERGAINTALSLDEYRDRLLTTGLASWLDYRDSHYRSQLIVVCDKQRDARNVAHRIREGHPTFDVAIAISDEGADGQRMLKRFRKRQADVLVTCMMAYEGLDAPFATHMIYLSNKRSIPWLEQATARVTRFNRVCGLPWEKQAAAVFAPGDQSMRAFVAQLDREQDDAFREHAKREAPGGVPRRGDFCPISAEATTVVAGGDGVGVPSAEVQEQVAKLKAEIPTLQHVPFADLVKLANRVHGRHLDPAAE